MSWVQLVQSVCIAYGGHALPEQILSVEKEFGVEKTLILSMIYQESRCKADAMGASGDTGLMQIIPKWHQARIEDLGVSNLLDPLDNMRVGASLLSYLGVNDNPTDALVVYNGGYARPLASYTYANKVLDRKAEYDERLEAWLP